MYVVKHVGRSSDKKPESPMITGSSMKAIKFYIEKKAEKKKILYTQ